MHLDYIENPLDTLLRVMYPNGHRWTRVVTGDNGQPSMSVLDLKKARLKSMESKIEKAEDLLLTYQTEYDNAFDRWKEAKEKLENYHFNIDNVVSNALSNKSVLDELNDWMKHKVGLEERIHGKDAKLAVAIMLSMKNLYNEWEDLDDYMTKAKRVVDAKDKVLFEQENYVEMLNDQYESMKKEVEELEARRTELRSKLKSIRESREDQPTE